MVQNHCQSVRQKCCMSSLAVLTCLKHQGFHLVLVPAILSCDGHYCWFMARNSLCHIFILALGVAFYNFVDILRAVWPMSWGFKKFIPATCKIIFRIPNFMGFS